ncbi:hypothetical protein [Cognatishimia sp. F0-27]|uniref:hypothetical protein n=1 Tax=Cognatishimia sp. F0-27 TaxID=2816855 RepID=UPI001D0CCCD8|nr:hypothetical protein [Cognatishimia sp. F0-27]MCC1493056.1 hypothetical protein [Cognatishimia sp. F0-27]
MAPLFLLELVIIAAIFYIPLSRFAWFRKMSGYSEMFERESPWSLGAEEAYVEKISSAGSGPARREHDVLVCESNLGVKILVPTLLCVVMYMLLAEGIPNIAAGVSALVLFGIALWWSYYMWAFKVEVSGHQLATMDLLLRDRVYDLALLRRAEKDKNGCYRLEFSDGSVCHLIKYVTGHDALREVILAALRLNAEHHSLQHAHANSGARRASI